MPTSTLTVVVPAYNEQETIAPFTRELAAVLDGIGMDWTVLFVDDGSSDRTLDLLRDLNGSDSRFQAIALSRNFGKEIAMAAGLRYARGDAVVIMDADLQHPPRVISEFLARWREGYKVVFGDRRARDADGFLRRGYSAVFHAIFRRIARTPLQPGAVDFILMDRVAVDAVNRLNERTRFSKGLFSWVGFRSTVVPFDYGARAGGRSHWSFLKLARFALDGFVSFSNMPLKVWSYLGAVISLGALAYALYFILKTLIFHPDVPGFPSLIVSIMFFSGVQLVSLGIIGEYLARIYDEVKARPLFIVAEEVGLGEVQVSARQTVGEATSAKSATDA